MPATPPAARGEVLQWVATALVIIVAWEIVKRVLSVLTKDSKPSATTAAADVPDEYKDLQVPQEPHVEIATDPPTGLHTSNPSRPYRFENDNAFGSYLYFHPPAGDALSHGPPGLDDYKDYFKGKSRLWEIRIRISFTRPPTDATDLFFGIELEDYVPLSMATKQAQKIVIAAINQAVGGLYQSPGDDPKRKMGERERPCCVLPLWAFDQFVETPEGQEPPSLSDPGFPDMGKKRYKRIAEYAKEIDAFQKTFKVGPTYTLAFWGNSRFLDVINWMLIGIPLATPLDFNRFAGKPPVYVVFYGLQPNEDGKDGDHRHIQSRKSYYFRAALWSSARRPERALFERLTGESSEGADTSGPALKPKAKSLRRRIAGFFKPVFQECTTRMTR